jgi:glycosyltransferase involved in cell wall biosynthesis
MSVPRFSIIIPAYNAAAFIVKTLDSVRAQTFLDYEIIVVDDGSEDETATVVDAWFQEHKQIGYCIRQENKKIAGARNTGIRAAIGELIAFLDHDDFWKPLKLEAMNAAFQEHSYAVLVSHRMNVVKSGQVQYTTCNRQVVARMYEHLLFNGNALTPSSTVVRRDKALDIEGFRENPEFNTVEDYDFWLRLSQVGQFYFLDQVLADYSLIENSASSRIDYHYGNLEALLHNHFASHFKGSPDFYGRLLMRRRLAMVYRAAAGALHASRASHQRQMRYVTRMLYTYPYSLKNLARALVCLLS